MKILEITHSFVRNPQDYISHFLLTFFEGLETQNIKIKVISPHNSGLKRIENYGSIEVERFRYAYDKDEILAYKGNMHEIVLSNPFNLILLFNFIKYCIRNVKKDISDFDLIHLHWWLPFGIPVSFIANRYNKPLIISLHGTDVRLIKKYKILRYPMKWLSERVKAFFVVSNYIKNIMEEIGISNDKIYVLSMPVENELFFPEKHFNKNKVILTIARFTKQKRIEDIIEIANNIKNDKIIFHIIGDGPEKENIKNLINRYQLQNILIISPMDRKQIAKKIRSSDIFILLSQDEGFGMVVVESMLSGVPVILSNSGGFKNIINNNINGILVEHGDINQAILSIEKLIKNRNIRNKIVNNALKDANKYKRDNIAKRFIEIVKFISSGENIN